MTPAESYRKLAAELRTKAVHETNGQLAAEWNYLARCYTRLAEQADQNLDTNVWAEFPGPSPEGT
jgi:hypothetical protein